ncbi:MAG: hypothetical protein JWM11_575 [Planctomycetaceae bacterium]|nr:hypothetical protein [Planctomycetaceae bacterium]
MSAYEFCVSLSIMHPSIDPAVITSRLGVSPKRHRTVGEQRVTTKGVPLPGLNKESFWLATLHSGERLSSESISIEQFLADANGRLTQHREFFRELASSGGYLEYFIGWFGGGNFSATLEPVLMAAIADLGISIGFDVYAGEGFEHT